MPDYRPDIMNALKAFANQPLAQSATALLAALGYRSDKTFDLDPNSAGNFVANFGRDNLPHPQKALLSDWLSVDLLFQLTAGELSEQLSIFNTNRMDNTIIESYLFFAIHLRAESYTRTQLATITRQVNRLFPMPAMILFRHGDTLTLAIIDRRLNKRDTSKDVLEKVTLIKDIRTANPHRAHLEILHDLSLPELRRKHTVTNFVELHNAWQKTLDSSELNKRFFKEIANWYFWAVQHVQFPADVQPDEASRNAVNVIRLITRLIFVWFIKEKGLVPDALFDPRLIPTLLKDNAADAGSYYRAILQNLFFATLNQDMGKRAFRKRAKKAGRRDGNYMAHTLYRYQDYFTDPGEILTLFAGIPFLNGGLFECLDKPDPANPQKIIRIDGFSDRADNPVYVPNMLFFGDERDVDLNKAYGTRNKSYKTRGLIEIFKRYKFTIAENTPIEEEIALDPELLGKVFENLLAAYNPETETTARKQTGSFYTPREIVNYMVDESLLTYLETHLSGVDVEPRLRQLFAFTDAPHQFTAAETAALIKAINNLKILDPAVGSGAFPMGVLHKLVFILGKLDPNNARWKARQIEAVSRIPDSTIRQKAIADVEAAFDRNELDYGRKLYLIENCIYGVDIQPIAVQIAKLRFFISLVVDQRLDNTLDNRGIRPLPNLETKFVAANTLLGIEKPQQASLFRTGEIEAKEAELRDVRHKYFNARTPKTKRKYRAQDQRLRREIGELLKKYSFPEETVQKLANWDPYDPNASAAFFDPEWMFGVTGGFDVVIGNPPYVRQEKIKHLKPSLQSYACYTGTADLYVYFYERGMRLLCPYGVLTYITSNKFIRAGYGKNLRKFLGKKSKIKYIIDFGELPVFDAATFPMIFIAQNDTRKAEFSFTQVKSLEPPYPDMMALIRENGDQLPFEAASGDKWNLVGANLLNLLKKMESIGKPLSNYVGPNIYRGIITGFNTAFIIDGKKLAELIAEDARSAEIIKPLAVGDDVRKWQVNYKDKWLIVTKIGVEIKRYPAVFDHLSQWHKKLEKRQDQGKHWWELRACTYYSEFDKPKIIYPDIAKESRFAFDDTGMYFTNTTYFFPSTDLYLLGVLNSNVIWKYASEKLTVIGDANKGGRLRFFTQFVRDLPIPTTSPDQRAAIESRVTRILNAKKANPAADTSALEAEIDQLVYQLYGLTAEEIAIVEGHSG